MDVSLKIITNKKRKLNDDNLKKIKAKKSKKDTNESEIKPKKAKKEKLASKETKKSKKLKKKKVKIALKSENSTSVLTKSSKNEDALINEEDMYSKMSAWNELSLPKSLLKGLYTLGFYEPMPIQKLVVPDAIKERKSIIGAAQTGSGKTLAFGLPILSRLNDIEADNNGETNAEPKALILTPTRELAIQIKDHLQNVCKYQKTKVTVIVGGIAQKKQERLLKKCPEIVVATPGRLMQLIDEDNDYLNKLDKIRFLVIDEADRMIEKGHYTELEKILNLVNSDEKLTKKRQNFLFSATLTTNFHDKELKVKTNEALNGLIEKIQISKDPKVVDLTTKSFKAETLHETKIFCDKNNKDIYMYYFISKYQGRTLVFANSIDCVRRLTNVFRLLKRDPLHLHANMDQKQRLKNLEKFTKEENSILIASDVAARGLDIPGIQHVIHYQCPRSVEIYIHRSGRTARSLNEGLSVLLVAPDELYLYKKVLASFKQDTNLHDYPIDSDYFFECRKRILLARQINDLEHMTSKEKDNKNWFVKHAKMLDIEMDDEIKKESFVDYEQVQQRKSKLKTFKLQLDKMLKQLIIPRHFNKSYLKNDDFSRISSINNSNDTALNAMKNKKFKK
jgi:ATP-dependent RNA helicase DDX24/MAK5